MYFWFLPDPIFRGVSKTATKSKMEIFVAKVKTFVPNISMLDFVEILDKPLILLTHCTQCSRS